VTTPCRAIDLQTIATRADASRLTVSRVLGNSPRVAPATDWLRTLGLGIPEDIGFVVHVWTERMLGFAGIHQRRNHVASATIDLVATQLLHRERSLPEVPRQILIPSAWIEGVSINPAAT
jgi:DNA-binding LacI/PurR family transcriptional regulator